VWGGEKDPVHFQYPGFSIPEADASDPWWSVFFPGKARNVLQVPAAATADYATCVLYSNMTPEECRAKYGRP
jgi:hypothetical protein